MGSSPIKGKWYTDKPGYTSSDFGRTWKKKGALTAKQKIMETLAARAPKFTHSISKIGPKAKELIKTYKGVAGRLGGKALGTLGFFLSPMSASAADQPGPGGKSVMGKYNPKTGKYE